MANSLTINNNMGEIDQRQGLPVCQYIYQPLEIGDINININMKDRDSLDEKEFKQMIL